MQFSVLRLCFFQDRNVRVRVFPESEEISVSGFGFRGVTGQCVSTAKAQVRERADEFIKHDTAVVQSLLKLTGGGGSIFCRDVGLAADINRIKGGSKSSLVRYT